MPLPPAAGRLATDRLDAVDAAAPGLVTAFRVTGSAALTRAVLASAGAVLAWAGEVAVTRPAGRAGPAPS